MEVSGQLHAPAAFLPGKKPPVLIEYEGEWTQLSVWTFWRREKSLVQTLDCPSQ
jgi:hypothetical protein